MTNTRPWFKQNAKATREPATSKEFHIYKNMTDSITFKCYILNIKKKVYFDTRIYSFVLFFFDLFFKTAYFQSMTDASLELH